MNKSLLFAAVVSVFAFASCSKSSVTSLETQEDSFSYALGVHNGVNISEQLLNGETNGPAYDAFLKGLEDAKDMPDSVLQIYIEALKIGSSVEQLDEDTTLPFSSKTFIAALKQAIADEELLISADSAPQIISTIQTNMQKKQFGANIAKGKQFLSQNAKKAGVKTTASGLQYEILAGDSTGVNPTDADEVAVNYKGTLIDGTVFDDSKQHGDKPAVFPLRGVVKGFAEGLKLMSVGDKFKLYIPQELAYGEHGAPGIEPFSALIFEVELVAINPNKK